MKHTQKQKLKNESKNKYKSKLEHLLTTANLLTKTQLGLPLGGCIHLLGAVWTVERLGWAVTFPSHRKRQKELKGGSGYKRCDYEVGPEIPRIFLSITVMPHPYPFVSCGPITGSFSWFQRGIAQCRCMTDEEGGDLGVCEAAGEPWGGQQGLVSPMARAAGVWEPRLLRTRRGHSWRVGAGHVGNCRGLRGHEWPPMSFHSFQRLWGGNKDHSCPDLPTNILSSPLPDVEQVEGCQRGRRRVRMHGVRPRTWSQPLRIPASTWELLCWMAVRPVAQVQVASGLISLNGQTTGIYKGPVPVQKIVLFPC